MLKIRIEEGMRFQHNPYEEGNEFIARKLDYYGDGEPIWCAETEEFLIPLDEIIIENYIPMADGVWVNEPVELEY